MSKFSFVGKIISFSDDLGLITEKSKDLPDTPDYDLVSSKNTDIISNVLNDADSVEKAANRSVGDLEVNSNYPGGLLITKLGKYKNLGKKKPDYKGLQPKLSDVRERNRML